MEILFTILAVYLLIGAVLGVMSVLKDPREIVMSFLVLLFLWPFVLYKLRSWS